MSSGVNELVSLVQLVIDAVHLNIAVLRGFNLHPSTLVQLVLTPSCSFPQLTEQYDHWTSGFVDHLTHHLTRRCDEQRCNGFSTFH